MTHLLEEQRADFARRRFLAMPLAGTFVWLIVAIASVTLSPSMAAWVLLIGTGSIFWFAVLISQFTDEDLLGRRGPRNEFDRLFFSVIASTWLVFAIAIPFFLENHASLSLSVGILTGLMWLPFSWIVSSWIGYAHGISRTALVLIAWYVFPQHRMLAVALVIVTMYLITIFLLERRWRALQETQMPIPSRAARAVRE